VGWSGTSCNKSELFSVEVDMNLADSADLADFDINIETFIRQNILVFYTMN
jgi:hypothetical protein